MRSYLPYLAAPLLASTAWAADICNGHAELCDRPYSSVTFMGAHNSYAVGEGLGDNQLKDVTAQLDDGIRTLQVQTHNNGDEVHVCHTSCSIQDGGTLTSYLQKVSDWVSGNPNDVISLIIVNIDNLPPTTFAQSFASAGLEQYAFAPEQATLTVSDWPTLGSMIDSGKRVVAFMDNTADFSQVPWLIDQFNNMFEDAYDVTEQSFECAVNRTRGQPATQLMMVNHFLDTVNSFGGQTFWLPDRSKLNETNAEDGYGSIGAHVQNCNMLWGRNPNHILLDYYDSNGNAPFNVAASLNGVPAPTNTIVPHTPDSSPSVTGALASGGSGSGSGSGTGSGAVVETSRLGNGAFAQTSMSTGTLVAVGGVVGGLLMGVLGVVA